MSCKLIIHTQMISPETIPAEWLRYYSQLYIQPQIWLSWGSTSYVIAFNKFLFCLNLLEWFLMFTRRTLAIFCPFISSLTYLFFFFWFLPCKSFNFIIFLCSLSCISEGIERKVNTEKRKTLKRPLVCFQLLAIMSKTAINIQVQLFVWTCFQLIWVDI